MGDIPKLIRNIKESNPSVRFSKKLDLYYSFINPLDNAIKNGNHADIIKYAHSSIFCLEIVILNDTLFDLMHNEKISNKVIDKIKSNEKYEDVAFKFLKEQYPDLNPNSKIKGKTEIKLGHIPCIDYFGDYCAITGYIGQLKNIEEIVNYYDDLFKWRERVKLMFEKFNIGVKIRKFLQLNPGFVQTNIKKELSINDGRMISNICYGLEKYQIIKREKDGKSYKLFLLKEYK